MNQNQLTHEQIRNAKPDLIVNFIKNNTNCRLIEKVISILFEENNQDVINCLLDTQNLIDWKKSFCVSQIENKIFRYGNEHYFNIMKEQQIFSTSNTYRRQFWLEIAIRNNQNDFILNHLTDWLTNKTMFSKALQYCIIYNNSIIRDFLLTNDDLKHLLTKTAMNTSLRSISKMNMDTFKIMSSKYIELFDN
jgi:hypothetical protein